MPDAGKPDLAALQAALAHDSYPRASRYDPLWIIENQMGPHALWLMESLTNAMTIEPGMRVLDLGCGRAMTSIFLAKEFDAHVTAMDLWIPAEQNRERIREAGVEARVEAVHAEAHSMPFDLASFDAIVSVDAYHYFGTDNLYIGHIASYLREGGRIGIVVPGVTAEVEAAPPEVLAPYWEWEFVSFHSVDWWRQHWARTGRVEVERAESIPGALENWARWSRILEPFMEGPWVEMNRDEIMMLEADALDRNGGGGGPHLDFVQLVARKGGAS